MQFKESTNAARFANALKRNGVEYIFGQSNPTKIMLESMALGIRQISFRQENTGTYMAQAYAMASGRIPVVAAQNGPAATLLVPGLAENFKAGHPVVAIVQEIHLQHAEKNAFQEFDHERLFDSCAKWVKTIYSADRIEDYVDMAFMAAASGKPGPAVLICPQDIFNDTTTSLIPTHRKAQLAYYPLDRPVASKDKIKEAAKLLLNAENPMVYVGGGIFSSRAVDEVRKLQKEFSLPVATTTMGKGSVDETDPLTVGVIGYYMGHRSMTKFLKPLVQKSDVVLLIGNRTNQNGTDSWTLLPENATYIHIDIDPMEIGRNYESLRLLGDAKATIGALIEEMRKGDISKRKSNEAFVISEIEDGRRKHQEEIKDVMSSEISPIRIERFMSELEKQAPSNCMIVADASFSSIWNANYIVAKKDREFYFPRGLAGLGWGFPMAMGCKLANPEKPVFSLSGDGGFAHTWSELETCRREGINVIAAVINNKILGYQYYAEKYKFGDVTNAVWIETVDYAKVAESCGLKGLTIETVEDIKPVLEEAFETVKTQTVVIDIKTETFCQPPLPMIDALKIIELV